MSSAGTDIGLGSSVLVRGDEKRAMVRAMFDSIAPRYDVMNRLISCGLDGSWRRRTADALGLPPRALVLDLACGTGDFCRLLAKRGLRPIGLDMSEGMLRKATGGAPLILGDALSLPLADSSVDGVVCGFGLRNFTEIPPVASELAARRATGWTRRPARGVETAWVSHARRLPRLVRACGAGDREPHLRSGRIQVPSRFRRVPAVAGATQGDVAVGRFRRCGEAHVHRGSHSALHRHPLWHPWSSNRESGGGSVTQNLDLELDLVDNWPLDLHAATIPLELPNAVELGAAAASICTSLCPSDRGADAGSTLACNGVLFESSRRSVVGLGVAARLTLAHGTSDPIGVKNVYKRLAEIPCIDPLRRPGSSVMAMGALPFDPNAPGELVIPEVTFVRDEDGTSWVIVVGTGALQVPDLPRSPGTPLGGERSKGPSTWPAETGIPDLAEGAVLVESGDDAFVDAVRTALDEIGARRVQKVVLARRMLVDFRSTVDVGATIEALRRREGSSTIFAVTSPGSAFVGASPELLVARDGPLVRSVPLAGTVRMTGNPASDQSAVARLAASTKENLEHRLVVDVVAAQLASSCRMLPVPRDPEILWLRQIAHLATPMSGRLEGEPSGWPSALELAAALHPTPAVGGSPAATALELIAKLEPHGRGLYAGPVGWVDGRGNGQFVIGIRSSQVAGTSASFCAGAGIVAGSDPQDELAETSFKLDTMLGALTTT